MEDIIRCNTQLAQDEAMKIISTVRGIGFLSQTEQDKVAESAAKIFNLCEELKNLPKKGQSN